MNQVYPHIFRSREKECWSPAFDQFVPDARTQGVRLLQDAPYVVQDLYEEWEG